MSEEKTDRKLSPLESALATKYNGVVINGTILEARFSSELKTLYLRVQFEEFESDHKPIKNITIESDHITAFLKMFFDKTFLLSMRKEFYTSQLIEKTVRVHILDTFSNIAISNGLEKVWFR